MPRRTVFTSVVSLALLLPTLALADWSDDPLVNLAVAAKEDEQAQPKVGMLPDGSAYVAWFDNDPTGSPPWGYDVFLQRYDSDGVAAWDPQGLRVADLGLSWTTDYGLDVDAEGNAVLAFREDRSGTEQITVTKISPGGVPLWGTEGVRVSSGDQGNYAPGVVVTSDGNVAVGWSGYDRKGPAAFVTMLDANGAPVWSAAIPSKGDVTHDFSDLAAGEDGSVIVLAVRTVNRLLDSERGLFAQKYSAKGRALWRKGVVVLDGMPLQGGEFPRILSDGGGGAVIAWYTSDPLDCWVQRLSADGTEIFPHDGLAVATSFHDRAEPSFALDATTGDAIVVYNDRGPEGYGVFGQRISPTGERLWTDDGVAIRPPDWAASTASPAVVSTPTGALATWIELLAYPDAAIHGAKVDAAGGLVCSGIEVSLAPGAKSRISGGATAQGGGVFAWEDGRNDFKDVFAQRIGPGCNLGLVP